jgi:hypothetical protein
MKSDGWETELVGLEHATAEQPMYGSISSHIFYP